MKAVVTIFFSLALVLSHLTGFASPTRQHCQNKSPCGCGNASCCVKTSDTAPVPMVPVPAQDNSRSQLLAVFQTVAGFVLVQPKLSVLPTFLPAPPALADVPLFMRNCSYLI